MKVALILLTLMTGVIDAFSYLVLGHVFVANMTGNVIFVALSLAGAPGFSVPASLLAIGAFLLGAFVGGVLGTCFHEQSERFLSVSAAVQTLFVGSSAVLILFVGTPLPGEYNSALIVALAIAMGLQNAVARKLNVADFTTTVLTLTITGIGADSRFAGGSGSRVLHRMTAVGAMFFGAGAGGFLLFQVSLIAPLMIALILLAFVAATARSWVVPVGQQSQRKPDGFPVTQELVSQVQMPSHGEETLLTSITN